MPLMIHGIATSGRLPPLVPGAARPVKVRECVRIQATMTWTYGGSCSNVNKRVFSRQRPAPGNYRKPWNRTILSKPEPVQARPIAWWGALSPWLESGTATMEEVTAITFTRKAAGELKGKAANRAGKGGWRTWMKLNKNRLKTALSNLTAVS